MNRRDIEKNLAISVGRRLNEKDIFIDLESKLEFSLNNFIEKIYVSDKESQIRVDLYEGDGGFIFRISGLGTLSDSELKKRGIDNIFFLGIR